MWNIIQTGDAFIMECQNIADKNAIPVASISTATRAHRTTRDKLHDAHEHTDCDSSSNATTTMITKNELCTQNQTCTQDYDTQNGDAKINSSKCLEGIDNLSVTACDDSKTRMSYNASEDLEKFLPLEVVKQGTSERSAIMKRASSDVGDTDNVRWLFEDVSEGYKSEGSLKSSSVTSPGQVDKAICTSADQGTRTSMNTTEDLEEDVAWYFDGRFDTEAGLKPNSVISPEQADKPTCTSADQGTRTSMNTTEDQEDDVAWYFDGRSDTEAEDEDEMLSIHSTDIHTDTKVTRLSRQEMAMPPPEQPGTPSNRMSSDSSGKYKDSPHSGMRDNVISKPVGYLDAVSISSRKKVESLEALLSSTLSLKPSTLFSKDSSRIMSRHLAADRASSVRNPVGATSLTSVHTSDKVHGNVVLNRPTSAEFLQNIVTADHVVCGGHQRKRDESKCDLISALG